MHSQRIRSARTLRFSGHFSAGASGVPSAFPGSLPPPGSLQSAVVPLGAARTTFSSASDKAKNFSRAISSSVAIRSPCTGYCLSAGEAGNKWHGTQHANSGEVGSGFLRCAQDDTKKVLTGRQAASLVLILGAGLSPAVQGSPLVRLFLPRPRARDAPRVSRDLRCAPVATGAHRAGDSSFMRSPLPLTTRIPPFIPFKLALLDAVPYFENRTR